MFCAVFGYDAMSTAAEESEDSQKHMPKAIIYSLAISMVLYVRGGDRAALPPARTAAQLRCPGMPVVPIVGAGFSIWLISFLEAQTYLRFAIWFLIGLVVYFGYGRRHSLLARVGGSPAARAPER